MTLSDEDKMAELEEHLERTRTERDQALNVIDEVRARLDAVSSELRKRGDYPLASQLDRDRFRVERRVNDIRTDQSH